jgi:hypothetical protein
MKPSFDIIPKVAVHPTCINVYNQIAWYPYKPGRKNYENDTDITNDLFENVDTITGEILANGSFIKKSPAAHLLTSDKNYHGKVSNQTRRKMGKAVDYLLYLANDKYLPDTANGKAYSFKIAFVTLTLPSKQVHSDDEIKDKCLNQLLVELRKRYNVKNYLWRAERQKNGNIHFHILLDKFIPWSELRDRWNRIINKLQYIERYRDEMKDFHKNGFQARKDLFKHWDYQSQIKAYKQGKINDWNSPNSTDIHSLYKISKVKEYISKYTTKDEQNSEVKGRFWGCNFELSHLTGGTTELDSYLKSELNGLIAKYKPKCYDGDYFTVIHIDVNKLNCIEFENLFNLFTSYLHEHFLVDIEHRLNMS